MAMTQQEKRTIPRSQQVRQRKEQAFEGIEENEYAVDPRTGWRFYKQAQGKLSPSSPSSSSTKIGNATVGRQEVGILGILHGLTIREFFLRVRTSFGWRRGKLPDNRRGVWRELPLARHIGARKAHQRTQCTSTVARDANTSGSNPTRLKANTAQDDASW